MECQPLKVLIIDDEAMLRSTMRAYFEDIGFEVVEAANGLEGLHVFRSEQPDAVFTDLRMPVMDGFGVIEALKRESPRTPVIVVSGLGTLGDAIRAVRLGAWDYVTKPIQELEELELTVRSALERASLLAENEAYREHLEELVARRTRDLEESEARFRTLFETSGDAILLLREGVICAANPAAEALFGCPLDALRDKHLTTINPLDQPLGAVSGTELLHRLQEVEKGVTQQFDWQHQRDNGELFAVEIGMNRLELGDAPYVQAIFHDISERKIYEAKLYHQANFDSLTGLPNRHLLTERLSLCLARAAEDDTLVAVILLDIDKFKNINDILGHRAGDELLCQLAERLIPLCGADDLLARFVGDEFVMVKTKCHSLDDMSALAHRIIEAFKAPFSVDESEFFMTACAGLIAASGGEGETPENLLMQVEAAMYKAKQSGVGLIQVFDREISAEVEAKLIIENRLRKAFDRGELSLYYQPQVDLASGTIIGAEALLRWTPPGEAIIYPASFISVLEETGLMMPVGEWVIRESCRQLRAWRDQGLPPLRMSTNITAWHLYSSKLLDLIIAALAENGLEPSCLCLEVTESIVMHDIAEATRNLQRLHNLGIHLSIDDFGTGYSSLSYLTRMPIDELKIDRSFIMDVPSDSGSAAIVTTILGMAETLNLEVVAEGVETAAQYRFLAGLNCHSVQGFYFSRAIPADEFARLLGDWCPGAMDTNRE